MGREYVSGVIEKHAGRLGGLVAILQDIQSRYGYLPADAVKIVAEETGRSLTDVYGVATFYKSFSLKPRGKHLCSVCLGTACHVRGGPVIADELGRRLCAGIDRGCGRPLLRQRQPGQDKGDHRTDAGGAGQSRCHD